MLFTRYNLFKNHGDFVHLNMLKWALKYVPEFGKSTVPDDETVKSMEIGTGGVDINTVKDATGEEKSKHVPYTDFQINGVSQPTFKLLTYDNGEARWEPKRNTFFDRYTKVINPEDAGKTVYYPINGIAFDKARVNVDGTSHNYIAKLKYYNREQTGALIDVNHDLEFKPYTSVKRDDDSIVSSVKLIHHGNKLRGINFTSTNEHYDIEVTKDTLFNMVYPVGSIYMSLNEANPATLFGGTWEKIEDRFLLGANSGHPAGSLDGSWDVQLTQANMPNYKIGDVLSVVPRQHQHWNNGGVHDVEMGTATPDKLGLQAAQGNEATSGKQYGWSISTNGGGQPVHVVQPFMAVNIWKRTA